MFFQKSVLCLIRCYQRFFPHCYRGRCRYMPTCSQYAYLAIQKFGVFFGLCCTIGRLARCHPFGGSGWDPIPDDCSLKTVLSRVKRCMDIKQVVLLVALCGVSYFLLLQWDQRPVKAPIQQAVEPHHNDTSVDVSRTTHTDVPMPTAQSERDVPQARGGIAVSEADLVTVDTDNYRIQISLHGGDIVHLDLPQYFVSNTSDRPVSLVGPRGQVLQSHAGWIGEDAWSSQGESLMYRTNRSSYSMGQKDDLTVTLKSNYRGIDIEKQYLFKRGSHYINVAYRLYNGTKKRWSGHFFIQLKKPITDQNTEGDFDLLAASPFSERAEQIAISTAQQKIDIFEFDEMRKIERQSDSGWVAIFGKYFVTALASDPSQNEMHYFSLKEVNHRALAGFYQAEIHIAPGESQATQAVLYAGPKLQQALKQTDNLQLVVDYGWLWWLAHPLFLLLSFFNDFLQNWGFSIIAVTLVVKLLFYPFSSSGYRSMEKMRRSSQKIQDMREQYKDNMQKMSMEMMSFYKREGINPLGGCLPMLIQMPVFIALYWVLMESVELRQAPWIFWITDLSDRDPYFILPLLMTACMYLQTKFHPTPMDPNNPAASMMKWMPIVFGVLFLWFPAGLVLYSFVNTLLSILQQWWITKSSTL